MKESSPPPTLRTILVFWYPLATTWLLMSVEGPFLSAIIARLPEPKFNLAAYGVAFSFALVVEAPVIMMMSAATALVRNRLTYIKLRNFALLLCAATTVVMLIVVLPAVFFPLAEKVVGLPHAVAALTHRGMILLIPWPGAIGLRRFYQGVLIRHNLTRRVAMGTIIRLIAMGSTALLLFAFTGVSGIMVGAAALAAGVCAEAAASRMMVHGTVRRLMGAVADSVDTGPENPSPGYRKIAGFYLPLALTPMIAMGALPIATFFMTHSRMAIESLAVFPVINSLVFIFRSMGLSFMEVAIALMGEQYHGYPTLKKFATILGLAVISLLGLVAVTPAAEFWFGVVSGLSAELTHFSQVPTLIFVLIPGLSVLLSLQRSVLVAARRTAPITWATVLELGVIIIALTVTIHFLDFTGAVAAALSLVIGRLCANSYLLLPMKRSLAAGRSY